MQINSDRDYTEVWITDRPISDLLKSCITDKSGVIFRCLDVHETQLPTGLFKALTIATSELFAAGTCELLAMDGLFEPPERVFYLNKCEQPWRVHR